MSRRRHISEEDSSLELLLDTMCNTFGGVMFIAITLFVLLSNSVFKTITQTPPQTPAENIETLRNELDSLQKLLAARRVKIQQAQEELKIQQDSPIRRQQQELILLRKLLQESNISRKQRQLDQQALQLQIIKLEKNLADVNAQQQTLTTKQIKLQLQQLQLQQKLQQLKSTPVRQLSMHFKVLQESQSAPFFIILHQDKFYPVGPWQSPGKPDQPDEAVTVREVKKGSSTVFYCQIKPSYGRPILEQNVLSADFMDFLRKIPSDRVPKFYIPPASAPTAYRMRELLKAANIIHGCVLGVNDQEDFNYAYTDNVTYEY